MRKSDVLGSLIALAGGGTALAADIASPALPELPSTGDPWADVVAFGLKLLAITAAGCIPPVVGALMRGGKDEKKKRKRKDEDDEKDRE